MKIKKQEAFDTPTPHSIKKEAFMILGNQVGNQKGLTIIDSLVLALIMGAIICGALFFDINEIVAGITG